MSAAPPTPPPPDEEEIARLAALAALNESIPINSSLFGNSSLTMQLQSEVFIDDTTSLMKLMPLSSTNKLNAIPT